MISSSPVLLQERRLLNDNRGATHAGLLEQPTDCSFRPLEVFQLVMDADPLLDSLEDECLAGIATSPTMIIQIPVSTPHQDAPAGLFVDQK